jgi:hypothetical protein
VIVMEALSCMMAAAVNLGFIFGIFFFWGGGGGGGGGLGVMILFLHPISFL